MIARSKGILPRKIFSIGCECDRIAKCVSLIGLVNTHQPSAHEECHIYCPHFSPQLDLKIMMTDE